MNDLGVIDAVITGAFATVGYAWRRLWTSQDRLRREQAEQGKEIAEHKLHIAENYPPKSDMVNGFDRIYDKLDVISDKLGEKADRK